LRRAILSIQDYVPDSIGILRKAYCKIYMKASGAYLINVHPIPDFSLTKLLRYDMPDSLYWPLTPDG
jgi:hypothetical protein